MIRSQLVKKNVGQSKNFRWRSILSYLLLAGVGLTSILIAAFGGSDYVSWSGWIYMLIIPLQVLLYLFLRRRKIAAFQTAEHIP